MPAIPSSRGSGCAGLLLTGGASRRMGRPKATLVTPEGSTFADRLASLLSGCTGPTLEVGGTYTALEAVPDALPGAGPLAALASGGAALRQRGWGGPAVVLSCDLPLLGPGALRLLVGWPGTATVVPVVGGRDQPLVARYSAQALARAEALVAAGRRRLSDLLGEVEVTHLAPEEWEGEADPAEFEDVDRPGDLERLRR